VHIVVEGFANATGGQMNHSRLRESTV
jgi:hypothetical protein